MARSLTPSMIIPHKPVLIRTIILGILVLSLIQLNYSGKVQNYPLSIINDESEFQEYYRLEEVTLIKSAVAHPPIEIDGNTELGEFCTVGEGTEIDPFIIENFEIDASTAHGIYIQNTDAHLIIRNCSVVDGQSIGEYSGIFLRVCENVIISNNELIDNYHGIYLAYGCYYNNISNNTATNNEYGIDLYQFSYSSILDNTVANNQHGISLVNSYNTTISGNYCSNNNYWGIMSDSDQNITISDNIIAESEYGIRMNSCTYNTISGNDCSMSGLYGIFLNSMSSYNNVFDNYCSTNYYNGIYLSEGCDYNTIKSNNLTKNADGIRLYGVNYPCSYNNISNNSCYDNFGFGIVLSLFSIYNVVWANSLYDNGVSQAYCTSINNQWYFEETGNYYGDYLQQNPTAINDGRVWNLPYTISGSAGDSDLYPLIADKPPTWEIFPTDQVLNEGDIFSYQVSATDNIAIDTYWLNDTSYFMINETGLITNISTLDAGMYWLEVFVNDTDGNAISASFSISVLDISPPTWEIIPMNQVLTEKENFSYQVSATDNIAIDTYWLNDTSSFSIDEAGLMANTSNLEVGMYWIEVFVNNTGGNAISASFSISVLENSPTSPDDDATDDDATDDDATDDDSSSRIPGYSVYLMILAGIASLFSIMVRRKHVRIV
ncbi:MAG: right-handed parallel beta-helix repeat-containing protein [Promethearchaeota archaeon]